MLAAMARVVSQAEVFELPADRPAKIAVVADTHSQPHPGARTHLGALQPDLILHGGDIGDLEVLERLRKLAPLIAVRGNIDAHAPGVPDEVILELRRGEKSALRIFMTHIAVYGPKLRADVRRRALAAGAQLVVCGHSHVPLIIRDGGLVVFNPGSIGPRRFHLPIVFGLMTLGEKLSMKHVDCETGEVWLPPGQERPRI